MCGIIGYTGKKNSIPIIMDGLSSLEYRGYDSAGITYIKNKEIHTIKSIGKIENLKNKIDKSLESNTGIGHTIWATHGGVTLNNCHPHTCNSVTLVHNGIIENYLSLKKILLDKGYSFYGETDTEVLAGYIDYCYKETKDKVLAIDKAIKSITGSYALGIIFNDETDTIYATRKDSPLIVGLSADGNFIASDMPAIAKYTNKYFLLNAGDIVTLHKFSYTVTNNNKEIKKEILTYEHSVDEQDLSGYDHYMLKEINEEPVLIRNNIVKNLDNIPDIKKYKNIYIVGCGSAYHAGLVSKYTMEKYLKKPVYVYLASEFRYNELFLTKDDLVIVISQSGETADTLASLRIAHTYKATVLALVNVFASSIARESDIVIYTNALTEISVATTKAYIMQVYYLGLLTIKNSNLDYQELFDNYKLLPSLLENIINLNIYKDIAKILSKQKDIYFLGRKADYAISMEGSLKLKEISYIHSEAYPAGELKHGTISLIEDNTVVISVITDPTIEDKTCSNILEVISRGAKSIIIATDDIHVDKQYYDYLIKVPTTIDILKPLLAVVPLQLLSYYTAVLLGCEIDKPRNLAKSVTVE